MRYLLFFWMLCLSLTTAGQDRSKEALDFLNNQTKHPFTTEENITGMCFIILAEDFDYYQNPIVIKGTNGEEVLRIALAASELLTTYKGKTYKEHDLNNTFKPWLFMDDADYFRIAFECVDTIGSSYKVRLSEGDFALIDKKNQNFRKESVADFVSRWASVGFDFNRAINPVREFPEENSKAINSQRPTGI